MESAQSIVIKPGQEARADFNLTAAPVYSVSGTITGLPFNVWPTLVKSGENGTQSGLIPMQYDPHTGHFVIRMVPPGTSTFRLFSAGAVGDQYEASVQVNIKDANVNGLQVALQPGIEIPVQVNAPSNQTVIDGSERSDGSVKIQLLPLKPMITQRYSAYGSSLARFRNVLPGQYQVIVQTRGQNCVGSVSSGDIDLSQAPLTVEPGTPSQPLVVTLKSDCASLSGTVRLTNSDAVATVLLTSASFFFESQQIRVSGPNATFSIRNLPPGTYRIYALSNINGLEYANPAVMRDLSGQDLGTC